VIVLIAPLAIPADVIRIILSLVDHATQIVPAIVILARLPTLAMIVQTIISWMELLVQVLNSQEDISYLTFSRSMYFQLYNLL